MYYNEEHARRVKERGDNYEYIGSYNCKEVTLDGKNKGKRKRCYIRVKCYYCSNEFDVISHNFFNRNGKCGNCCQSYENSFAYYIQQELNEPLNKYWDWEKNTVNPYLIYKYRKGTTKNGDNWKVWIKCTKTDYHGSYEISCNAFVHGQRCSYCSHKGTSNNVHINDSYGILFPELAKYWSPNNNITPYEVSHGTNKKYLHICENCNCEFERSLHSMTSKDTGCVCNECQGSKGETMIKRILTKKFNMVKGEDYLPQMKFQGLIGTRNYPLSYDFYLPKLNLLIEYQGEFHNGNTRCQTKEDIKRQQEHDERKFEFAKNNNIRLLEIWYWDYDNIEEILTRELIDV